jgi:hypothetical protein
VLVADLQKCAEIATELEASRAAARSLLGEKYSAKVAPWRDAVRKLAVNFGCRPIEVPLFLEAEGHLPEHPLLLFAAIVDVVEEDARG